MTGISNQAMDVPGREGTELKSKRWRYFARASASSRDGGRSIYGRLAVTDNSRYGDHRNFIQRRMQAYRTGVF